MDPHRFDALTRSLAAPKTRRGLLGSLGALAAGLLGARAADAQQVTQAHCGNVICGSDPGRCKAGCVCCVWGNGNTRCTPPGNCTGTPTCPPGTVVDPVRGCVPPTTTTAAPATTTPAPATTQAPAATTTSTTTAPTTAAPTTTTAAPTTLAPTTTAAPATTTTARPTTTTAAPTTTTTSTTTSTTTTAAPTTTTTAAPTTSTTAAPTTTSTTTTAPGEVCSPTLTCPSGQRCCGTDTCYVAENCDPAIGHCGKCTSTCKDAELGWVIPVADPPCDGTDRTEARHMCVPGTCQDNQVYCGPSGYQLVDGVCREVCGAPGNYCPAGTHCCGSQICCNDADQLCLLNPVQCVDICPSGADRCGDVCCDPNTQICVGGVCKTKCGGTSCDPDTQICCSSICCDKSTRVCGSSPGTCAPLPTCSSSQVYIPGTGCCPRIAACGTPPVQCCDLFTETCDVATQQCIPQE